MICAQVVDARRERRSAAREAILECERCAVWNWKLCVDMLPGGANATRTLKRVMRKPPTARGSSPSYIYVANNRENVLDCGGAQCHFPPWTSPVRIVLFSLAQILPGQAWPGPIGGLNHYASLWERPSS